MTFVISSFLQAFPGLKSRPAGAIVPQSRQNTAPVGDMFAPTFSGVDGDRDLEISGKRKAHPGPAVPVSANSLSAIRETQAWRFAALIQQRLAHPVGEKLIAKPESPTPGSQDWNGGVFTYIGPGGERVRVGRTRNGKDRGGETWVDFSLDGGKTWQRKTAITKTDEAIAAGKAVASVERPYLYGKTVNGEPWVVLGTCAAEKGTKRWDIHEREAPLAHLERLKDAPVRVALPGNARFAYKDGVPVQAPDSRGIYLAATRHHIGGTPEAAVNADTVLCRLNEETGLYEIIEMAHPDGALLARRARGDLDTTCNRLSGELVLPDGSRFWACDIRNAEAPNASLQSPLKPGKPQKWALGDFDEITSFSVATWPEGAPTPEVASVKAVLGRSSHSRYPTLRYLGLTPLVAPGALADLAAASEPAPGAANGNEPVLLLTYEKAGPAGAKSTFQQTISRREMAAALSGHGPELRLGQDPLQD